VKKSDLPVGFRCHLFRCKHVLENAKCHKDIPTGLVIKPPKKGAKAYYPKKILDVIHGGLS
jgi:hypothetical protein